MGRLNAVTDGSSTCVMVLCVLTWRLLTISAPRLSVLKDVVQSMATVILLIHASAGMVTLEITARRQLPSQAAKMGDPASLTNTALAMMAGVETFVTFPSVCLDATLTKDIVTAPTSVSANLDGKEVRVTYVFHIQVAMKNMVHVKSPGNVIVLQAGVEPCVTLKLENPYHHHYHHPHHHHHHHYHHLHQHHLALLDQSVSSSSTRITF